MKYPVFQGSCGCRDALEKHLARIKHTYKTNQRSLWTNREKYSWRAPNMTPK